MGVGLGNLAPNMICDWIIGKGTANYNYLDNANAYIGVGDSTTAYAPSQTDLQAATNKLRNGMFDATYPSRSGATLTFKARFLDADAVWAWNEIGLFNASTAGQMLTRDVPSVSLGTKPNNQTWDLTVTLTLS